MSYSFLSEHENLKKNPIENDLYQVSMEKKVNYLWSEIINYNAPEYNGQMFLVNNHPKSILDSKFYLMKKIGEGFSSKVYLGLSIESLSNNYNSHLLKYYSIKVMDASKTNLDMFKMELNLLERINHDNIIKIYAYGLGKKKSKKKEKEVYYMVMEHLEHDELLKYITNIIPGENIGFGEDFGRLIFAQLLDGVEAMHTLNIYHRDIKPNNIMVGGNNYIFKFIDFGLSTDQTGILNSFLGTPNYSAPELHLKRGYFGKSEDIFSLGITLFVLVTGLLPFKLAVPNDNLYQYFVKGDYIEFWRKRMVNVSPSFMELFDNMVAFDFSQRPSLSEIRESAWMKEINWDLMPLLKQELILREKKIKIYEENQQKKKLLLNRENIEQTPQIVNSLLQAKKPIKHYNPILNGNDIKNNDLNNSMTKSINNINANQINNKQNEQKKGMIRMKNKIKKINLLMKKIKQYLKNEGYVSYIPNCQKLNKLEFEVSDGEVDILIKIEKQKANYIKLRYFKIKGFSHQFESFKNVINSLKASKVLLKH